MTLDKVKSGRKLHSTFLWSKKENKYCLKFPPDLLRIYLDSIILSSSIFLKPLDFANKRQLSVAIICGENELKDNTITIKNLKGVKGQNSQTVTKADLIDEVRKFI